MGRLKLKRQVTHGFLFLLQLIFEVAGLYFLTKAVPSCKSNVKGCHVIAEIDGKTLHCRVGLFAVIVP